MTTPHSYFALSSPRLCRERSPPNFSSHCEKEHPSSVLPPVARSCRGRAPLKGTNENYENQG